MLILSFLAFLIFAPETHVRLNQNGFAPGDPKTAIVFGRESLPAEFRILSVPAGSPVFRSQTIAIIKVSAYLRTRQSITAGGRAVTA